MIHSLTATRLSAAALCTSLMLGMLPGVDARGEQPVVYELSPLHMRAAERMQGRVEKLLGHHYEVHDLADALRNKSALLHKSVSMHFIGSDGKEVADTWEVTMNAHSDWLVFVAGEKPEFMLDDRRVRQYVADNIEDILPMVSHATILSINDNGIARAEIAGHPSPGYTIDERAAGSLLADALQDGIQNIGVEAVYEEPKIFEVGTDRVRELTLLSSGKSDFGGSPYGRRHNVEKAFLDHVQHVVVKAGEKFSFNKVIANPISGNNSWAPAMVIMNGGKDLVSEPGGGICQAATTVFRAALLAGLPIIKRANHSLYVTYYKDFGVGIDATFYPGKQDLVFENDTGSDIVFVSRIEGDEAYVDIYGTPDGRSVALDGPFFAKNNPGDFTVGQRKLAINEIGWRQTVIAADGTEKEHIITSRYVALPRTLHEEYPVSRGTAELLGTYTAPETEAEVAMR